MECPVLAISVSCALLVFSAANAVKVSPKFDFGDTSPGISPENTKISIGNDETSLNPGIVKAMLEVTVGEAVVTGKHTTKPDKKGDKNSTKTKILLCTLEGDCKIHEIGIGGNDSDEEEDGGKKKLKPVIVTGFNEDPLKGNENSDDNGKKNYNVPVIVGYRGAAKDDGFYYTGYGSGQSTDRLPPYYGMTPRPVFYQTYPGASTYENVPHIPSRPDFSHGYGPRTPSPYGKLHPTRKPDSFHAIITPIGRHNDRPTVYRPINKPTEPGVVALHGKMNFDEDQVSVWGTGPLNPISGQGNIKVDGKLGEPLNKSAP